MADVCIARDALRGANPRAARPTVALVVSEGMSPFHLAGALLVLGQDSDGHSPVNLQICSSGPDPIHTSVGFELHQLAGIDAVDTAQAVLIPGWPTPDTPIPKALIEAIQRAHARGTQIVGLGLGVLVLAQASILDGKQATTHWRYASALKRRFPQIRVNGNMLYVREGNVWTSAGGAAAIDTCLLLLEGLCGPGVAQKVASQVICGPHRHGEHAQIVKLPARESALDKAISRALDHIRSSPGEPYRIESLAARAQVSARTFNRRFKALTGSTFSQWLLVQRLAYAKRLLENQDARIEWVATLAGFGSTRVLLHHFRRTFGISPSEYHRASAA